MVIATQNRNFFFFFFLRLGSRIHLNNFVRAWQLMFQERWPNSAFDMSLLGVVSSWSEIGQLGLARPCGPSVWVVMFTSYPGIGQSLNL